MSVSVCGLVKQTVFCVWKCFGRLSVCTQLTLCRLLQDNRTKAALELLERLVGAQQAAEPATAPERPPVELKANASGKARLQAAEQSLAGCVPLVVRLGDVPGEVGGAVCCSKWLQRKLRLAAKTRDHSLYHR